MTQRSEDRGMLSIFPPGFLPPDEEETEQMMNALVTDGLVEVVDEGPPRRYRLTAAGITHVEALLASSGVSPAEAMAWLDERLADGEDTGP
jgi:DNA-binding PadR family transcriptional regulator